MEIGNQQDETSTMMRDKQQAQLIILIIFLCGLFFMIGLKIGLSECPEPEVQVIQEGMIQVDCHMAKSRNKKNECQKIL